MVKLLKSWPVYTTDAKSSIILLLGAQPAAEVNKELLERLIMQNDTVYVESATGTVKKRNRPKPENDLNTYLQRISSMKDSMKDMSSKPIGFISPYRHNKGK